MRPRTAMGTWVVAAVAAVSLQCASAPTVSSLAPTVVPRPESSRLLFTRERVLALRRAMAAETPAWKRTRQNCEEAVEHPIDGGYEAWSWAHAVASLASCWFATGDARYRTAGVRYVIALLDDRVKVGDGEGGDRAAEHDDGYAIRTHGAFAALGFDWFRGAPELSSDVVRRLVARLDRWIDFYRTRGYLREQPIANHFIGYFFAMAATGIALDGTSPRAAEHLSFVRAKLLSRLIAPAFARSLEGGDWPESFQYGDMVTFALALYADAESRIAGGPDVFAALPWLRDTVRARVHATLPDGVHAYDGGDWSEKPARMPPFALFALAALLPSRDPAKGEALALARGIGGDLHESAWMAAIADDPQADAVDPHRGVPSALLRGTGLVLARSDWSPDATFVSLQSGPTVTPDHQHSDQGHVSIVRGRDALFVDAGEYGAASTMSHNSILVDDGGESLSYAPNQGRWGALSSVTRYEDVGDFVVARGDFGDSYAPAPDAGRRPSVLSAIRDLVFLRPGVILIHDDVEVAQPNYGVSIAFHGGSEPIVLPTSVTVRVGGSRAIATVLSPAGATLSRIAEPSPSGEGPWFGNDPAEKSASRVEIASPRGERRRVFVVAIDVGARTANPRRFIATDDGRSVLVDDDEGARSVAFAEDGRASTLGPGARRDVVVGLAKGARYAVRAFTDGPKCRVTVRPSAAGEEGREASLAGTIAYRVSGCSIR